MSQREFGGALGSSHRSATRWDARQAEPSRNALRTLAALLAPVDATLAAETAAHLGETLESLGLVAAPPPSPAPPPAPAPPVPTPMPAPVPTPPNDLADVIVCAGAEAMNAPPQVVRPLILAVFRRARQLGLTVEEVERALAPPPPPTEKKAEPRRARDG
jgi:hypothetical protein